ncbi:MAG: helix-turn-helix domain-containing protein [Thermomicrobiales bacterium]
MDTIARTSPRATAADDTAHVVDVAGHDVTGAFCPVYSRAIEVIGRRWTGAILRALLSGATRFTDITTVIPGLSDRLLSERLKELEAEGIVTRGVTPSHPVRIEYGLTAKGYALNEVILAVSTWAETWGSSGTGDGTHVSLAEPDRGEVTAPRETP